MLELFLEFFGEFLVQALGELLLEAGLHSLAEPFRQRPNPYLAALGYVVFGAFLGGLSLWPLPRHLTPPGAARIVNLALTPVAVGLCMAAVGKWRAHRGDTVFRIDRFSYGYLFALSLAVVRFFFAT